MQFIKNTKPLLLVMALAIGIFGFYLYRFFTRVKPLPDAYPASEEFILKDIKYGPDTMNYLDLYLPSGRTSKTPVIIVIHGGAWVMGDKSDFWSDMSLEYFNEKIIVANINYRFVNTSMHYLHILQDVKHVIDFLKLHSPHYKIPLNKYNLVGTSAGGHIALLYAYIADTARVISSVVSFAGLTNVNDVAVKNIMEKNWGLANLHSNLLGEEFVPDSKTARNCSPLYNIKPVPTLLIHAPDDDVVPYEQSQQLNDSLQLKKIKHILFTLPNGKHSPFGTNNAFKGVIQEMVVKWVRDN